MSLFQKRRDAEDFERAAAENEKSVYRTCLSMLKHREDAEDCLQETMLRAYRAYGQFDGRARLSTWFYRIAVNTCVDYIRKRRNEVSLDALRDDGFDPGDRKQNVYSSLEESERKRLLKEALDLMPEDARALIVLRDVEGLSYDEAAQALNLPLGTLKSRLSRAREKLCALLSKNAELFRSAHV